MELVGSVRPFAKSFHRCPCCISFSARNCRRFVCLKSEAVLGALLILQASESAFYYVLDRALVYKKNIRIETGTYNALFRSLPRPGVYSLDRLPQPTAASTS